jgi:glycosyltransferase involved in cell wall biosynthesis
VVWCNADALRAACAATGIEVVQAPFPGPSECPWWRPDRGQVDDALGLIRELGAAVVHVNTLNCLPWALRAARAAKVPILAHIHVPTTAGERIWAGLHQATIEVGVSRFTLDWTRADSVSSRATRLIYSGVVPERLEQGDATGVRAQQGIPEEAFLAVTVGSLIPRKDLPTVIQAVRIATPAIPELHLLVVGEGDARARLEAQAAEAGLRDRIHFAGDRSDAGAILRDAADLLVSAALSETFGLNVVEAGYFGVPSVVTAIPPHREIVEDGRNGLLFEPGDPAQLAERITRLAAAPALRRALGAEASARVRKFYLADRFVREFEELYLSLMARPRWRNGWLGGVRLPASYWRLLLSRASGRG